MGGDIGGSLETESGGRGHKYAASLLWFAREMMCYSSSALYRVGCWMQPMSSRTGGILAKAIKDVITHVACP